MSGSVPGLPVALEGLVTLELSCPAEHVLLVTLNRPKVLNVFNKEMEEEMGCVLRWADESKYIWVIILTGAGSTFCAGGDIKPALAAIRAAPDDPIQLSVFGGTTDDGFAYLTRRPNSVKPIIAAVNGLTVGGGIEIVLNCDLVVASERAKFGLVEARNSLVAVHGAIPRLVRVAGHQLASEAYLVGRTLSAQEACDRFGFVNRVVAEDKVVPTAIDMANEIVASAISAGKASASSGLQGETLDCALEAIRTMKRRLVKSRNLVDAESSARL